MPRFSPGHRSFTGGLLLIPKGPCPQILHTLGPMYPYRDYFSGQCMYYMSTWTLRGCHACPVGKVGDRLALLETSPRQGNPENHRNEQNFQGGHVSAKSLTKKTRLNKQSPIHEPSAANPNSQVPEQPPPCPRYLRPRPQGLKLWIL